ncbi:unnamed protein product [Closterium sp. NIES-53]
MSGQLTLHGAFSQKRSRVSVDAPSLRESNPSLFSLLHSVAQPEMPAKKQQQEVLKRRVTTSAHPSQCSHAPLNHTSDSAARDSNINSINKIYSNSIGKSNSKSNNAEQTRSDAVARYALHNTVLRADILRSDSSSAADPSNDSPAFPIANGPRSFPSARGNGSDARVLPSLRSSPGDRNSPGDRTLPKDANVSRDRNSEDFAQARSHRSLPPSLPSSRVLVLSESEGAGGVGRVGRVGMGGGDSVAGWQQQHGRRKKRQRALSSSEGVCSASIPKRQAHFNHYADGMGWWGDSAVGVDVEEVGMSGTTWEGHGFLFHDPEGF